MGTSTNVSGKRGPAEGRFTKETWLAAALEALARDGNASLRIERLSSDLKVSKGSFYWHFKNREAFLHAVVDYWEEHYTRRVRDVAEEAGGGPRDRLRHVVRLVVSEGLADYDFAMQGWASRQPAVADRLRKVHQFRWRYVRSLFRQMGFEGTELEFRTHAFLGFMSLQPPLGRGRRKRPPKARLDRWMEFFTAK